MVGARSLVLSPITGSKAGGSSSLPFPKQQPIAVLLAPPALWPTLR
eukprot:CAMPEP_0181201628 /NCGR_PEP_ID=MMETSP1096-20121128/18409_1 /TAXON_ID=156174 ORGANISM="Chrysochromulina ericina, Strain CCMP281" /NCGR_SAMPLE_ID=MMETSP1096 /ASSEMBLY_ACC=CAM_ASM_000453 /LENGTH=45 /DNA_ID= /DNA_START= /DNA_END= /DNA_ORIENTATION=